MKKINFLLLGVMVVGMLLSACAPSARRVVPTVEVGGVRIDPQALIATGRQYYNGGVQQETTLTNLWRKYEQSMSTFRTGVRDLVANKESCYVDVAATESTIAQSVTGNMDGDAIFSALVSQSVSGEAATVECTKLNRQLADFTIANRQAVQDNLLAAFEAATKLMQYTSQYPEIDITNDLLQTYGDTTKVYKVLADNGIGVTDWSWLPTANLWVAHSDEKLCRYYTSGEFMANVSYSTKLKFTGHEDALARLYESTWNPAANGGRGECRMTRYAALEYMTRSILSSDTREVIETGEDTGVIPTEAPAP